jgi:predicted DNA-binding protein (MmcQ/YjbR family)
MTIEQVRRLCLAMPHAAESIKWENSIVFSVDGKMFAVAGLEPGPVWLSFKCSPEDYAELIERPEIRPAPYLARAHWVALETPHALSGKEIGRRLETAYKIVFAKLPGRRREALLSR